MLAKARRGSALRQGVEMSRCQVRWVVGVVAMAALIATDAMAEPERKRSAEDYFREGVDHLGAGRNDDAIQSFKFCVQYQKEQKECWFNLGVAYGRKRDFSSETAAYQKAVGLDPNYGRAHFNLGVAYEDLGQADKALRHYERAIAAEPKTQDARLNRAMLLLTSKRVDEAVRAFEAAVKVKDDNPEAWFDLAEALDIQAEKKQEPARTKGLRAAISTYYKAIHLDARHYRAHYNIGLIHSRLKDRESEVAAYRKCISLRPKYTPALYNLAFALRDTRDIAGAAEAFRAYLRVAADHKHEDKFRAVARRELQKLAARPERPAPAAAAPSKP